jgi:nucleotide-binding universal stress UspA family protein
MTTPTAPFASVLVPYDGSDPARSALKHALELTAFGGKLCIITVVNDTPLVTESSLSLNAYDPTELFAALDDAGASEVSEAVKQCSLKHITPTTELVHDTAVRGIVETAAQHKCDLIVMGTHGRTGIARFVLGSTTAGVIRDCTIPVLVVR